ncbi:hypothetical protein PAXRUDRAFT_19520 [Paxillus rubicundulus Ve08.2h10]|uniref:Uncharacterized protein n=1 Tax=Paxillus rubicundulus Ve08.2h10 TaxID=930991 RepID=A0A0D0DC31_9AGAM|nr:hypothetical protein PAXRUDRAFT_19520 [Paxillus rubicundulus Ve08.2h10]
MDGNFSAEHMKLKNDDDFNLSGGSSYFTALPRYRAHLQITDDKQPKSTCHEHKAVNQVHATQKHLTATGIGAIACARHGCFVPDTVVDFQKGKRQVNMDYALCQALGKLQGMPRAAHIMPVMGPLNVYSVLVKVWAGPAVIQVKHEFASWYTYGQARCKSVQ